VCVCLLKNLALFEIRSSIRTIRMSFKSSYSIFHYFIFKKSATLFVLLLSLSKSFFHSFEAINMKILFIDIIIISSNVIQKLNFHSSKKSHVAINGRLLVMVYSHLPFIFTCINMMLQMYLKLKVLFNYRFQNIKGKLNKLQCKCGKQCTN